MYGQQVSINGVKFSFHPAGHVIGSAQIRVEHKGEIWVASGDYKTVNDGISGAFEVVRCHTYITESTFGLPIYQWPSQKEVFKEINAWWSANKMESRTSIISAYSLGKAQRILHNVDQSIGPVYCHESVDSMNRVVRSAGVDLAESRLLTNEVKWDQLKGALMIAPGNAYGTPWMEKVKACSTAAASGWMATRSSRGWQSVDQSFVMSDHADWAGLNETINATGAERVIVTHGYTDVFAKWLRARGYDASTEKTMS
jgi:putative mRNA 3-end processing factor